MRIFRIIFSLCIIAVLFYSIISVRIYRVSGDSMNPVLQDGEIVIVDRISRHFTPLTRGEMIVFNDTTSDIMTPRVKRVIGLPHQEIVISDGNISEKIKENIIKINEPYLSPDVRTCIPGACMDLRGFTFIVPGDSYFVLGDRRLDSVDSRGCTEIDRCDGLSPHYIPDDEVLGRFIFSF